MSESSNRRRGVGPKCRAGASVPRERLPCATTRSSVPVSSSLSAHSDRPRAQTTPTPSGAHLHAGHRPDPLRQLRGMPSGRRDRADVAHHLRRGASVGSVDRATGLKRNDASVARGCAARHIPQRTEPDARAEGRDRPMDVGGRARRKPLGPSCRAHICGGLAHRHAGRGLRDAGRLLRSREGHDRVRELLHPHQLHRGEVAQGHRGASGQPRPRPPHPRVLRDASRGRPRPPPCSCRTARTAASRPERKDRDRRGGPDSLPACSRPMHQARTRRCSRPARRFDLPPGGTLHLQMHYTATVRPAPIVQRSG